MTALVEALGLRVEYRSLAVLQNINFRLEAGEIVTIVGPNGSGKTTLLRTLIGAIRPTSGVVRRAAGLRVGYVPQTLAIDRAMPLTVERFLGLSAATASQRRAALERAGAGRLASRQLMELSGGELQRALLARAILLRPGLLALDEPTKGLDQPGAAAFYRLVAEMRRELGCAILLVSHDLHVVMSASDRVVCLNGHICCEGAPTDVSNAPEYRRLFGFGAEGALALYRHEHDHRHDPASDHREAPGAK